MQGVLSDYMAELSPLSAGFEEPLYSTWTFSRRCHTISSTNEISSDIHRPNWTKPAYVSNIRIDLIIENQKFLYDLHERQKLINAITQSACDVSDTLRRNPRINASTTMTHTLTPANASPYPRRGNKSVFRFSKSQSYTSKNNFWRSKISPQLLVEEEPQKTSKKITFSNNIGKSNLTQSPTKIKTKVQEETILRRTRSICIADCAPYVKINTSNESEHAFKHNSTNINSTCVFEKAKVPTTSNFDRSSRINEPELQSKKSFKIYINNKLFNKMKKSKHQFRVAISKSAHFLRSLTKKGHRSNASEEIPNVEHKSQVRQLGDLETTENIQYGWLNKPSDTSGDASFIPKSDAEIPFEIHGPLVRKREVINKFKVDVCGTNELFGGNLKRYKIRDSQNYKLYSGKRLRDYVKFCKNEKRQYEREYEKIADIAVESNSEVHLMLDKIKNKLIVSKKIFFNTCWVNIHSERQKKYLPMEVYAARLLSGGEHFVNLEGLFDFGYCFVMLTGFCGCEWVELSVFIRQKLVKNVDRAYVIFENLVEAIANMHKMGIVHNDLKQENIVVNTSTLNIKISDFGSVTILDKDVVSSPFTGTVGYARRAVNFNEDFIRLAQESWALGCILYSLFYGKHPFGSPKQVILRDIEEFLFNDMEPVSSGQDENYSHDLLNDMKVLMRVLLNENYKIRPTTQKLRDILLSKTVKEAYPEYYEDCEESSELYKHVRQDYSHSLCSLFSLR